MAPEFAVTTLAGEKLKLADLRGKVVLIDFWATWCVPCVAQLPEIEQAYKELGDKGLVIVGVSFDQQQQAAAKFVEKRKLAWHQVWADGGEKSDLAKLYHVSGIPATFLIGPDGKVMETYLHGEKLLSKVRAAVEKLEAAE